jgi:hypothetical protein
LQIFENSSIVLRTANLSTCLDTYVEALQCDQIGRRSVAFCANSNEKN